MLFSLSLQAQDEKSGFTLEQLQDNPQDSERICYSDGTDTLQGWKIHSYDVIEGYGFTIIDISGNEVVGAFELDPSLCEYRPSNCVESQEWTYGIDNTGTRFSDLADYQLTLSDGSTLQWSQTATSSWTPQLTEWATNIQAAADAAGLSWLVEPRAVNNPIPTDISGNYGNNPTGLPGAPSVPVAIALIDGGMVARYVNFQICPGQPVPVKAERLTSQLYTNNPYNLTSAGAVLGPTQKFFVCRDCGKEPTWYLEDGITLASYGQIPFCYEPCGTLSALPPPPENDCAYEIDVACDNNNQPIQSNFTNTITRRATVCNGEQIAVDYFQADPNDASALIAYTLVGSFVDCATGEEVPEPEPAIVIDECIKNEICIDGVSNAWEVKTITSDGKITITYENQTGEIEPPSNWDIGTCECEFFEYWILENYTDGLIRSEYETGNSVITSSQWGDAGVATSIMDAFVPNTPTTAPIVVGGGFITNDTESSSAIQDIEFKEGYIIVNSPISIYFNTNSEGAIRFEYGQCCGPLETQFTHAKGVGNSPSPTIDIPIGTHRIKITNLDQGGSNSNWNTYVSYDGINFSLDNTPIGVSFSSTKPIEVCQKGYVCDGKYYEENKSTEVVFSESVLSCQVSCAPSNPEVEVINTSISEIEVCADGSPAVQKTILDSDGIETVSYYNQTGLITPINVVAGSCTKTSECVKWRNKYVGIDNTGTSFSTTYDIEVRDSEDNAVGTFTQTPSANNTLQLNQWIAGLQNLYPNALIEQRYAPSGGAGLPPPTTGVDFDEMAARYVQFTACDGDDLPSSLFIISENSVPLTNPNEMDVQVIFGEEVRGYVCYECGIEPTVYYTDGSIVDLADIPPCYITCAEGFEEAETTNTGVGGTSPTAQEIADAIQDNERSTTVRILNVQNNTNDVTLPVPAGTMGCINVVEDTGAGLVYWTIEGSTPAPSSSTTFVTTGPYHAAYNVCNIDLSLVVFNGSSTGSDYSIIYTIY